MVLYNEGLDNDVITRAVRAISQADTLIIRGTSFVVYPAAGLIDYFRDKKLFLIYKNYFYNVKWLIYYYNLLIINQPH